MPVWNARIRAASLMEQARRLLEADDSQLQTKGSGKGNKGNKQKQWKHGGGAAVAGVTQPKPLTGLQCKCCGRTNHTKSQCHHKEKTCDICGKVGHVKAVCRHADADTAAAAAAAAAATAPAGNAPKKDANACSPCNDAAVVLKVPWTCRKCHA